MNKPFFTVQLQARGISQREAGRRMGLASSQMVRLLDGKRKLQLSGAVELAQMLNLSLNEILLHAGGDGRIAEPPPRHSGCSSLSRRNSGSVRCRTGPHRRQSAGLDGWLGLFLRSRSATPRYLPHWQVLPRTIKRARAGHGDAQARIQQGHIQLLRHVPELKPHG